MEYYISIFASLILVCLVFYIYNYYKLKRGLCILMYHHIGNKYDEKSGGFFVLSNMFEKQLDLLVREGFYPISLSEVEDCFINKKKIPSRSVLLTFDDGYANNYEFAYPLAKKKNIPIAIFVNTGEISQKPEMLTWEQIKEMQKSGVVDISSHGMFHKRLRRLSDEEALYELTESKSMIEKETGKVVQSFCYPFGAFDKRVRKLVFEAGYKMDFGTRKGINHWPWNSARPLLRAHIMHGESMEDFPCQLKTGYKNKFISRLF
ncbi:MAG: polysaccharide deacetylase family protein [Candidatus Azobacteroides sp.]|nr:polysaccharide deacetylase family protein [Candidatus Azobacteroides sp.]